MWKCSTIKVELEVLISAKNIHIFLRQALFRRILNYLTIYLSSAQDQGLKVTIFPSPDELAEFLSGNCETIND